jgi:sulfatase modifying factor 1
MNRRLLLPGLLTLAFLAACASEKSAPEAPVQVRRQAAAAKEAAPAVAAQPKALEPFSQLVPGTTVNLDMKPVPSDTSAGAKPFWIASTETTWDMYDAYLFAMDRPETDPETKADPPDAWTRPSKPYILMDRGFGHAGYPAISISYKGASEFCRWLGAKTKKHFRLPTESEWERACLARPVDAARPGGVYCFGDDPSQLADYAWFKDDSEVEMRLSTHPVAQKKPNALGLFDMHGNAAEWTAGPDGKGVVRGGSFKDAADAVTATARRLEDRKWNASDPQVPKSVWWLADGGFIGFRVACEPDDTARK